MKILKISSVIMIVIALASCKKNDSGSQSSSSTSGYEKTIASEYNSANSFNTTIFNGISLNNNYISTNDFKVNDNMYHMDDSLFSMNYMKYCKTVFQSGMMGGNMMGNGSFTLNGYMIMNIDSLWNSMMSKNRNMRYYKMDSIMGKMMIGSMMMNKSSSTINTYMGKMQDLRKNHTTMHKI